MTARALRDARSTAIRLRSADMNPLFADMGDRATRWRRGTTAYNARAPIRHARATRVP